MPQSATPTGKPAARRRSSTLLGLALVLLTLALALPAGAFAFIPTGGGGWLKQSSGTTAHLFAVAFPDAAHGWAVGHDINAKSGAIRAATTSGGSSPTSTPQAIPSSSGRSATSTRSMTAARRRR